MTTVGWVITAGTIWFCLLWIAVIIGWRFTAIRPTFDAVLRERIDAPTVGPDVWAGLDRALADTDQARWVWDSHCEDAVLLTHEADEGLSEDNEAYADDFIAWTNEIRERTR